VLKINKVCLICGIFVDGIVHSCFFPVEKNDRLEVTGHEKCLRETISDWDGKKRNLEETKRILGLEVE